ncbi:MAG: hypothetical protein Roseis2KO_22410 [Roseivirga sp.]
MINHNGKLYADIFLAGAPKSGSTFLFSALANHSGICASEPKEPDFYLDRNNPYRKPEKHLLKKKYQDYFSSLNDHLLHLDGTQLTIYQTDLINTIAHFTKKPKILFIFREPAERILSSFRYTSNNLSAVNDMTFSQYVDYLLSGDDEAIKSHCKNVQAGYSLSNELRFSDYGFYLHKWREAVGAENIKVFLFEDMKSNTQDCYEQICHFLGLQKEPMQAKIDQMNRSVEIKNKRVHYILHKLYGLTGYKVPFKKQIKQLYGSLQHKKGGQGPDVTIEIDKLRAYYRPLNEKLAEDFRLNLSTWE